MRRVSPARLGLALVAAVVAGGPAEASTVVRLDPPALEAGADRVVDGRVIATRTRWAGGGLETVATVAVERVHKGGAAATLELVVPGGELDGARHVIAGMPAVAVGEEARWFLRERGDGTHRVYGWAQGKWPARVSGGKRTFAPAPVAAEHATGAAAFTTNGMVWPASKIPVRYRVQRAGSDDVTLADAIAAIDAAFATWQAVPTSALTFANAGLTDLGLAVDDENVILFVESGWSFGSEAAAAASLFILDGQQTADIAINGEHFRWAIEPANADVTQRRLDLQAVLVHEIGHLAGLGHTTRAYDTMYFSWKPWHDQRTLSIDDKLGLSSIYPATGNECELAGAPGCPEAETCAQYPLGRLCTGVPDPVGAPCDYDRVECDAFCLFTATDLSAGYCSRFCERDTDCPLTHHCAEASSGGQPVKVCFVGPQQPPPPECARDGDCPGGTHCNAGACRAECQASSDCGPTAACDQRGACVAIEAGGCSSAGGAGMLAAAWGVALLAVRRRRRATARA
jgi:hypothetical protein